MPAADKPCGMGISFPVPAQVETRPAPAGIRIAAPVSISPS